MASIPASAAADDFACPDNFLDASGMDQPEGEVREVRNEMRGLCSVLDENADLAAGDAQGLHSDLVDVVAGLDALRAEMSDMRDDLGAGIDVRPDVGRDPESPSFTSSPASDEAAQAGFAALHSGIWYLAGIAASMIAAYGIYRQVMPRA